MENTELMQQAARYENRIAELETECARLAKRESELMYDLFMTEAKALADKARLNWLLSQMSGGVIKLNGEAMNAWCNGADWITAIDAAMAKEDGK
jgi:hypothetical protein